MAEVDFGLLGQQPNVVSTYTNAFTAGRDLARQKIAQSALAQYPINPDAAVTSLMAVDPAAAQNLHQYQIAQQDRASRQAASDAYAKGDITGAEAALAPTGDVAGQTSLHNEALTLHNAQLVAAQTEATKLWTSTAHITDPDARKAAILAGFDADKDNYAQYAGASPAGISAIRDRLAQDPETTLRMLMAPPKYAATGVGDNLVVTNPDTGEIVGHWQGQKFLPLAPGGSVAEVGGDGSGGAAGGPPPAPSPGGPVAATTPPPPTGGVYGQIAQAATAAGGAASDVPYLSRLAQIESHGDPTATNGRSTGLFQFHPDTFAAAGGGDIHSVADQTKAALTTARQYRAMLQGKSLPTDDASVYILHQQGPAGGMALLSAPPEINAISALAPAYNGDMAMARKAIVGNGGTPDMTAGQFVNHWRQKWAGGAAPAASVAAAPAPAPGGARIVAHNDEGLLSGPALDLAAQKYNNNGEAPPVGNGALGAINRTRIMTRAAEMAAATGDTGAEQNARQAAVHSAGDALTQATTLRSSVQGSEQTALRNADLAMSLAPKGGGQTNSPVINRWIQHGRVAVAGDPDVAAFNAALGTFVDEYAKIIGGSTGGGAGTTDAAHRTAESRVNGAMTAQQLQSVVATMKTEMANRTASLQAQEASLKGTIGNGGREPQQVPADPQARTAGTYYQTPGGVGLWTGTGWKRP